MQTGLDADPSHAVNRPRPRTLALSALGVTFGDIGTSPLYTLRECFSHAGLPLTADTLMAVLSLIFWTLTVVVSVKYVLVMLRFDYRGEGGSLALLSLTLRGHRHHPARSAALMALGTVAAALFFGDAIITPAISVMAAVEGIAVVAPELRAWIVPTAATILAILFGVQRKGTSSVGRAFGPVMLAWFATLAVLGAASVLQAPIILQSLHPGRALWLFREMPQLSLLAMGAVFLCVTGAEALYADLGHFGRRPIEGAWFWIVFPALFLNYLGQGALLLRDPNAAANPFFLLAPEALRMPLVLLATVATVIASQAVISGAFSVTQQASRLNLLPRLKVRHTSETARGQIYISAVNWGLLIAVVALVVSFGSSAGLAAAYGLSVSADFVIGTLLLAAALFARGSVRPRPIRDDSIPGRIRRLAWLLLLPLAAYLVVELAFVTANLRKIADGGWFPLLVAGTLVVLMSTWRNGLDSLRRRKDVGPHAMIDGLTLDLGGAAQVPGTAVFLSSTATGCPSSFLHNLKHNKVVHERTCFLTVIFDDAPRLRDDGRVTLERGSNGICRLVARFGYREDPDIGLILRLARSQGLEIREESTSFFTSKPHVIVAGGPASATLHRRLFAWMLQNSPSVASYLGLPPQRVIEIGAQVVI